MGEDKLKKGRSSPCNGELLRQWRQQRHWTQEDLAAASDFSVRLIAKAEAGGSLSFESLKRLAKVLSDGKYQFHPEDLTCSPRELAWAFLRAILQYEGEAVSKCRHFLSEDLEVFFPGGPAAIPLSGVHRGIEAYENLMRTFFQIFQRPDKKLAESTAVVTAEGNQAFIACFEKLSNEFIPPDIPPAPIALLLVFSRGLLTTIEYLFDTTEFAPIVTAWREGSSGVVSHEYSQHMRVPEKKEGNLGHSLPKSPLEIVDKAR